MRVGVYFGDYQPDLGGGYTYVADLLEGFAAEVGKSAHHYVVLCDMPAVESFRTKIRGANVTVAGVPVQRRATALTGLYYFSPLARWMLRRRRAVLDVVAKRHGVELLWFVGVGAHVPPDIPYVANVWDVQYRLQPFFPEVSAEGIWTKRDQFYSQFLSRAAYCVTGAEANKEAISKIYGIPDSRVRVMHLPTPAFALSAPPSRLDVREKLGVAGDYVLYPAQFWPHKNHANLILALKWLKEERGVDLTLVLCGSDKGNLAYVRSFAQKHGMEARVRFLGFVSNEELVALYRGAAALTFPCYFGPDNLPPLEAFALGCPAILAETTGARELYGDAALLVDPSSPADIGRAIHTVLNDAAVRDRLKEAGLIRSRRWTSSHFLTGMFALFDEFAGIRRNWE
jgi:glycosyltransferase involved in cell wall biosynthesis